MALRLFVFDAYGTLFDVGSAARLEAAELGAKAWSTVGLCLAPVGVSLAIVLQGTARCR